MLVLLARGKMRLLKTQHPLAHALRGSMGFIALFCFFLALKYLPLADATVVFFSSTFILTALSELIF